MAKDIFEERDKLGNKLGGIEANRSLQTRLSVPDSQSKGYSDISDDSDFNITENVIKSGKRFFGDDRTPGVIIGIDPKTKKVKFEIGYSKTKMMKYDGKDLYIIGGAVTGGSINVPDATTPLFTVDSEGNVIANSLRRKDYHLFTIFDGIDNGGWGVDYGIGAGFGLESLNFKTAATTGSTASLSKQSSNTGFSWDKRFAWKTRMKLGSDFDSGTQTFDFGKVSGYGSDTTRKVSFRVVNTTLYGVMADNSTESTVNLMSTNSITGGYATFEIDYDPTTGASYYVNGVLKGTLATNIPSGVLLAGNIINYLLKTGENASKTVDIIWADFWQEF